MCQSCACHATAVQVCCIPRAIQFLALAFSPVHHDCQQHFAWSTDHCPCCAGVLAGAGAVLRRAEVHAGRLLGNAGPPHNGGRPAAPVQERCVSAPALGSPARQLSARGTKLSCRLDGRCAILLGGKACVRDVCRIVFTVAASWACAAFAHRPSDVLLDVSAPGATS